MRKYGRKDTIHSAGKENTVVNGELVKDRE